MLGADHGQAIGTVQFLDRGLERGGQVRLVLELVVEQVSDDFGIGVRGEHITQGLELFAQGFVVLDDAVVHHRQVAGEMRVGVTFARGAVRCPAGVGDTQAADQRRGFQGLLQFADLARTTHALQRIVVSEDCHTGAVIAAVFEALEAFEQNGGDITFRDCANNSTHVISPG